MMHWTTTAYIHYTHTCSMLILLHEMSSCLYIQYVYTCIHLCVKMYICTVIGDLFGTNVYVFYNLILEPEQTGRAGERCDA